MERILTVEEVAEVLRVKPFTVRKMFREKRLAGFKVGKAWRITESALQAEIERIHGFSEATRPEIAQEDRLEARDEEVLTGLPAGDQGAVGSLTDGEGHLLVFSDVPGQDVHLDGVKKGPTTLSITNVTAGEHMLRIGDKSAKVMVYKGVQVRVRRVGDELAVSVPPEAVSGLNAGAREGEGLDRYQLRLQVDNQTDFSGMFSILLSAEDPRLSTRMFGGEVGGPDESGMAVSKEIVANDRQTFFDGIIAAKEGEYLRVSVLEQSGFGAKGLKVFKIRPDMVIKIVLVLSGVFRPKRIVRFALEVDSS